MSTLDPARREQILSALRAQQIELPSWAFGNSGTRFKVFAQQGVPRNVWEKIDDRVYQAVHDAWLDPRAPRQPHPSTTGAHHAG